MRPASHSGRPPSHHHPCGGSSSHNNASPIFSAPGTTARSASPGSASMRPLAATARTTTTSTSASTATATGAAAGVSRKLIPSSSNCRKGMAAVRKYPGGTNTTTAAAATRPVPPSHGSRSGIPAPVNTSARTNAAAWSGTRPPRIPSSASGGGAIAVLATSCDGDEGVEVVPAYLTGVDAAAGGGGVVPLHPSRPRSAFNATLTLAGRHRGASASSSPQGGTTTTDVAATANSPEADMPEQPTYVVGRAVVNPFIPVSPAVQQGLRGVRPQQQQQQQAVVVVVSRPSSRHPSPPQQQQQQQTVVSEAATAAAEDAARYARPHAGPTIVSVSPLATPRAAAAVNPLSAGPADSPSMPTFQPVHALLSKRRRSTLSGGDDGDELLLGAIPLSCEVLQQQQEGLLFIESVSAARTRRHNGASSSAATTAPNNSPGANGRRRSGGSPVAATAGIATATVAAAAGGRAMQRLRTLYGTTADDIPARGFLMTAGGGGQTTTTSATPFKSKRRSQEGASSTGGYNPPPPLPYYSTAAATGDAMTLAYQVMPELMMAEARCAELAAARRRIHWNVALPTQAAITGSGGGGSGGGGGATLLQLGSRPEPGDALADTAAGGASTAAAMAAAAATTTPAMAPPPAIAFLDASGGPVAQLSKLHFTLNTASLTLERDVAEDMRIFMPNAAHIDNTNTSTSSGTVASVIAAGRPPPQSFTANKVAAAVRTVGQSVSQASGKPTCFRVHGVIGLMKGLAEKVGLDRAMEFRVSNLTDDGVMLLSEPYIDSDVGDLVVHVNPSLLGVVRLGITGFDCGCVVVDAGAVAESSNALTVVIRCVHAAPPPAMEGAKVGLLTPAQQQQLSPCTPAGGGGGGALSTASADCSPADSCGSGQGSPASFGLNLANFNGGPRSASRNGGGGGRAFPAAPGPLADGSAGNSPTATVTAAVTPFAATLRPFAPSAAVAIGLAVESANAEAAASAGYQFPATNPHDLRYEECALTARELIFDGIAAARNEAAVAAAARSKALGGGGGGGAASESAWGDDGNDDEDDEDEDDDTLSDDEEDNNGGVPGGATSMSSGTTAAVGGHALFAEKEAQWRRPTALRAGLLLGPLQAPISHLRLTVWQDRLSALFKAHGDQDLLTPEVRAEVKRQAKLEMAGLVLASLNASTAAAGGGRGYNYSHGHSPRGSFISSRAASGGAPFPTAQAAASANVPAPATSLQSIQTLRRLVLCLLLEENRASQQLFADVVELCGHLGRSALLRTIRTTGGTREGLQSSAAAALAPTPKASGNNSNSPNSHRRGNHRAFANASRSSEDDNDGEAAAAAAAETAVTDDSVSSNSNSRHPHSHGKQHLSEKERLNLILLSDALEVCLIAMVTIGCHVEAVAYATQRVHVECLVEGDTTASVCSAQGDLADMLLLYGDATGAMQVAEDVLMLAEQLYPPLSAEEVEAKLVIVIAGIGCGRVDRAAELVRGLVVSAGCASGACGDGGGGGHTNASGADKYPTDGNSGGVHLTPPLRAKIQLVYALSRPFIAAVPSTTTATTHSNNISDDKDDVYYRRHTVDAALTEAIALLSCDGDTVEMDRSFSTVMPSAAYNSSGNNTGATAAAAAVGTHRRLCWNLLCLACNLLVQSGQVDRGIGLLETVVEELALGQHRLVERRHRASLGALLWVTLLSTKMWATPSETRDLRPALRQSVKRVANTYGTFHPLAAMAHLNLATSLHGVPGGRALNSATRSLCVLERALSPRSPYIIYANTICGALCGISAGAGRWRQALQHANAALVVSQLTGTPPAMRSQQESALLGALLRCPATAVVRLPAPLLMEHLTSRVAEMEALHGAHSEHLAGPLMTLAEAHHLFGDFEAAFGCLQRGLRLADSKGVLTVSHAVVKPESQLRAMAAATAAASSNSSNAPGNKNASGSGVGNGSRGSTSAAGTAVAAACLEGLLERRRFALGHFMQSPARLLTVASLLFSIGATLEARAGSSSDAAATTSSSSSALLVAEAQDAYGRALAILEAAGLAGSLSAVRVQQALAKSHYAGGAYADALGWALAAERSVHARYKAWSQEAPAARALVAAVKEQILFKEGVFVCTTAAAAAAVATAGGRGAEAGEPGARGAGLIELL